MTVFTLIRRSIRCYWPSHLALLAGVAVATGVLVGSLLVGSSVPASLRTIALERLGRTDLALTSQTFFHAGLADELSHSAPPTVEPVLPVIILPAGVGNPDTQVSAPDAQLIGITPGFAALGPHAPPGLAGRECAVSATLARELEVKTGDRLLVTFPLTHDAPVTSPFARRSATDTAGALLVTVTAILPDSGLARFDLRAGRPNPRNVFLSLDWLAPQLDQTGRANTLLLAIQPGESPDLDALNETLRRSLTLSDFGLSITPDSSRLFLHHSRLVLPAFVVADATIAADSAGATSVSSSTYLANSISLPGRGTSVPYSIVTSLDPLGPLDLAGGSKFTGPLAPDRILINSWTAEQLAASPGDRVELAFFVSDLRGNLSTILRTFTLAGIFPADSPELSRRLVPPFRGITDARSLADWRPPFPIDLSRIRPADEDYWSRWGATPKAILAPEVLHGLWSAPREPSAQSPFVTSIVVTPARTEERLRQELPAQLPPERFGLVFRPVRQEALALAGSPTDYGQLFLAMSSFLVVAAAVLIVLLMRLSIERRASQMGILLATGFTPARTSCIVFVEATVIALVGTVTGMPLGVAYAGSILWTLRTTWSGAVASFPLHLSVSVPPLLSGALAGFMVATAAILFSLRVLNRVRVTALLGGGQSLATRPRPRARLVASLSGIVSILAAVTLIFTSVFAGVPATDSAFFLAGTGLLVGLLALLAARLIPAVQTPRNRHRLTLTRLALSGASRNWTRSMLVVSILAASSLLLVTVAAFRQDPRRLHPGERDSGAGGFNLVLTTQTPVHVDLGSTQGRLDLGFPRDSTALLEQVRFFPLSVSRGEDISCLNIQLVSTPRVLGVPSALVERNAFSFSRLDRSLLPADQGNPWKLLETTLPGGVVPAFADQATARWNLHLDLGDEITVPLDSGRQVRLRLVGLVRDSIFASELVISQENFVRAFGTEQGYRQFLLELPVQHEPEVARLLRRDLARLGPDVRTTTEILARYASVQNTYLSTFQTLGGLGLALGTFGLAAALVRSVIQRRAELAMLLALGFGRGRVVSLVLLENAFLLAVGLLTGTVAALVAVCPQLVLARTSINVLGVIVTLLTSMVVGIASCALAANVSVRSRLIAEIRSE